MLHFGNSNCWLEDKQTHKSPLRVTTQSRSQNYLSWNWSDTPPIRSQFHRYKRYQNNFKRAGVGFMLCVMQERPRTTIQNNQDGGRITNNTQDQQICTAKLTSHSLPFPPPAHPFGYLLLTHLLWSSLYLHHRRFSDWFKPFTRNSQARSSAPWKSKSDLQEPD